MFKVERQQVKALCCKLNCGNTLFLVSEKETFTMKTLTASNQRVQWYLTYSTDRPTTTIKYKRLLALKQSLEERNVMLDELFPNKQQDVLDHILYITSASGISKVGADKLAERCECSTRTVYSAVNALKSTGEFIVGRLIKTKGGAGKYIFVDKKHPDFKQIMREVFSLSDTRIKQLNAKEFSEQKLDESLDTSSVEGENQSPNLTIFSQTCSNNNVYKGNESDTEIIKQAIDQEPALNIDEQRQRLTDYATNEYQLLLFDFLRDIPRLDNLITDNLYKLALSVGSDATARHFHIAKDVIFELNMQLLSRQTVVKTSIRALFDSLYHERLKSLKSNCDALQDEIEVFADKTDIARQDLFYNWLEVRE